MDPQKFGRYEIRAEIGRGGMATVYHAYDPRFEREVAIKVLPREMLHDLQFRTRFEREAKTIAMLEHPAIVPVYDVGEEDGQPYFVMRYMTGGSLSDRMKLGSLTVQDAARLMTHLAPALDEAHAKGIVHRDLKPGNILYDQYNEPYVSDFGIAKLSEAQSTVTGSAIVGTPAYMSPEQAQGESIDGRSDIYGLGVILFEMFTGQQPYHGDTPMSVVVKHITDPVPHILDIKPDLPANLEKVVEKAMAKDRSQRYQTVKALAADLTSVANGEIPRFLQEDVTLVGAAATTVKASKPGQTLAETVLTKKAQAELAASTPTPAPTPTPAAAPVPPKRTGLWIGLGAVGVLVVLILIGLAIIFKNEIPFLVAPPPTQTRTSLPATMTPWPIPTAYTPVGIPSAIPTNTPLPTDTAAPSPTATTPGLAVIGGSDQVAFLSNYNIWTMNMDGTNLVQVTKDNAEKHDLQWSPDGQSLFFLSGKCIHYVTVADGKDTTLACFTASTYLESFEISPDGNQVAVTLDRVLFVVPFDLKALSTARYWTSLRDMPGKCIQYGGGIINQANQPLPKIVRWSADGKMIAADVIALNKDLKREDLIIVFNVKCGSDVAAWRDNFPGSRFIMSGYNTTPVIPFFSWDGRSLFLLNTSVRLKAGMLYGYNFDKQQGAVLKPLTACCYQSPVWSADGSQIMFAYQDIDHGGSVDLYLIPYGTLDTGVTYEPFELPKGMFSKPADAIEIALRKAK